ncbi:MAG: energy-coupled thiamine transporter ThiT [Coriobacteriales bacterium]|nr:energy-coupled thiamine transporter ThiT [Coriobacteriales bacterium]
MRNNKVLVLVEVGLAVALAAVLNLLAARLPINIAGGSISLSMLPIAVVALRRGVSAGFAAGFIFGALDLLFEPFIVHWAQVLLDYPLPYALFGVGTGLLAKPYKALFAGKAAQAVQSSQETPRPVTTGQSGQISQGSLLIVAAVIIGGLLRLVTHILSGVIFFAEYAGGENVWIYSIVYNASYMLPSIVITLLVTLIIVPILARVVPVQK